MSDQALPERLFVLSRPSGRAPETPARALGISLLALTVAGALALLEPGLPQRGRGLVWILALVPCFLLSYYRGWRGGTLSLVLGMVAITGAEVLGPVLLERSVDWWVFGITTVGLIGLSTGAGVTTELLHRSGGDPHLADRGRRTGRRLRRALEEDELLLHYQPIVSLEDRRVVGVEPLIRWRHPQRGLLRPDRFLPLVEETGLVIELGTWVLDRACRQVAGWNRSVRSGPPLTVHPNLSPAQFRDPGLEDRLRDVLGSTGLPAARLELEITERSAMQSPGRTRDLAELGVGVCIDDFGTGYSSLSYIEELAADALKIDISFVRGIGVSPETEAIIRAILTLGSSLEMAVVAEGVEREEQRQWLREEGCPFGQGHLFAPALPTGEVEEMLPA